MRMKHYLTIYDRETERLLPSPFTVPREYLDQVKRIAHVKQTDPDAIGSYPLDHTQVNEIARLLQLPVKADSRKIFFLEPAPD